MLELTLLLLLAVSAFAFLNWRQGLVLCVATAILQDPLRKMTPGQPVFFVVLVGAVFAAAWMGALVNRVKLSPNSIAGWREHVGIPFGLLVLLAIVQAFHSLAVYQNVTMTAIGVMSYFAPIPAVVFAYQFANRSGMAGVQRWMRFYVVIAIIALSTVILESQGASASILGEVGEGVWISGQGAYYKGNAGIFRAAEIAAWHGATVACFAFMIFKRRGYSVPRAIATLALVVFLLFIGALTGRRKMIIEITVFICAYFALRLWFTSGKGKLAILAAIVGIVTYVGVVGWMGRGPGDWVERSSQLEDATGDNFDRYSARAGTVFEDVPVRIRNMGLLPIEWAIDSHGWFGGGLGIGSQGAQHFGGVGSGAAEGGLGKLTVELGVPGLLLVLWFLLALARYIWKLLGILSRESKYHANFAYGIVAFLLANAATFSIATQAYGDIFILLSLGLMLGFLFAQLGLARQKSKNQVETKYYEARHFAELYEPNYRMTSGKNLDELWDMRAELEARQQNNRARLKLKNVIPEKWS